MLRKPDPEHVLSLVESVARDGLLQSLLVDSSGVVVAGVHRYCAVKILLAPKEADVAKFWTEVFGQSLSTDQCSVIASAREGSTFSAETLPVRVLDFDSSKHVERALRASVTENSHRRSLSNEVVASVIMKLMELGYEEVRGRPSAGQKPLNKALAECLGVSERHAGRLRKQLEAKGLLKADKLDTKAKRKVSKRSKAKPFSYSCSCQSLKATSPTLSAVCDATCKQPFLRKERKDA